LLVRLRLIFDFSDKVIVALQDSVCLVLLVQSEVLLDLAVFCIELLRQLKSFALELLSFLSDGVSFT